LTTDDRTWDGSTSVPCCWSQRLFRRVLVLFPLCYPFKVCCIVLAVVYLFSFKWLLFTCSASSYGAGVMQGLQPPLWIVNASITSSASATIWNVCPPKVTVSIVLPTGRAWLSSSVSTVASWILIMCCLVCVCERTTSGRRPYLNSTTWCLGGSRIHSGHPRRDSRSPSLRSWFRFRWCNLRTCIRSTLSCFVLVTASSTAFKNSVP